MKRTFRHKAEGRRWWIEATDSTLRIGFSDDTEPCEEVVRTRRTSSASAAKEELDRLVCEQLAEGFAEDFAETSAPSETTEAFFSRLHHAWRAAAPHIPSEVWLHEVQALPMAFRSRFHHEWPNTHFRSGVPWSQAYQEQAWLRMQVEIACAPYLLGLRDPPAAAFCLHTLANAPSDTPYLEATLISLVESPVPEESFMPGLAPTMCDFPFAPESVARIVEFAHSKDVHRASNAALLLSCSRRIRSSRVDVAGALLAWLALGDVPSSYVDTAIQHAVPVLGYSLHRDLKRPQTRAEFTRLLRRTQPPST